ncbi:DUF1648 domain-containing protein [Thermoactinomyces mirandus]|uniref:DUF1648 domain-containing protein n=1 Tax=Thermoactinomyces mirandus TaxID=2756294 RepID=A0A7W1XV11_9BACL|nr:DUF5808 domain-containing protein [Thermoactinomyces mirandus]MBA4603718.1 DUF1648 domain-containing protein [Thermoactinomyces mirandus]
MNMDILLISIIMLPIFIPFVFIPYWTRKTESFGVFIPEAVYDKPELKKLRSQYAWSMAMISAVTLAVFLATSAQSAGQAELLSQLFAYLILAYIIVSFLIYLFFHRKMKKLKKHAGWTEKKQQMVIIDTGFRHKKLTYSNLWFMVPFAIAIGTMLFLLNSYDQIPQTIPMQYDFSGEVTHYTEKSYRTVLIFPILQVYLTLLFLFINTIIAKAKQQVSAENPERSVRQNIIFRRRWSAFTILSGTAIVSIFLFTALSMVYPINPTLLMLIPVVVAIGIVFGAILLSLFTGQGGSRLKFSEGKNGETISRDDDQCWKLGQFYFNKNDPSVFVEKRFGIGWTNNWAHPLSWFFLILILGLAIGLPLLLL